MTHKLGIKNCQDVEYLLCFLSSSWAVILLDNNCHPLLSSEHPLAQKFLKNTNVPQLLVLTFITVILDQNILILQNSTLSETVAYFPSLNTSKIFFLLDFFTLIEAGNTHKSFKGRKLEKQNHIQVYCCIVFCFSVVIYLVKCLISIQLKSWQVLFINLVSFY